MATTQVPAQKSVLWSLPLVRTTAFPWMSYTEIWMGHWLRGHPDPRASPLLTFSPWDNLRGGPVFIAISHRGCLRHRDGKWLSQSPTGSGGTKIRTQEVSLQRPCSRLCHTAPVTAGITWLRFGFYLSLQTSGEGNSMHQMLNRCLLQEWIHEW